MAEQHVQIFKAMGLPEEKIQEIETLTPEQLKEWKPDTVLTDVKGLYESSFLNDSEFLNKIPEDKVPETVKKKIESGQYTRFQKELLEAATKQLGLDEKDLADLSEEDKKSIKKTVVKIAEKHLGKKGSVEGARQLQTQVSELTEALEKKDTDWQVKLDAKIEENNGAASVKLVKALLRADLAALTDLEFGVPVGYVSDPVLATLQNKYAVIIEGDGLTLKQKDNTALDVMKDGKKVSFEQALRETVVEMKLGKAKEQKKEDKEPSRTKIVVGGDGSGENDSIVIPEYIANKMPKE